MSASPLDQLNANLDRFVAQRKALLTARLEIVAVNLKEWAKAEDSFAHSTGDLEASIDAFVSEVTDRGCTVTLQASVSYAAFFELAKSGRWSFLWPVLELHKPDVLNILAGKSDGVATSG